MINKKQKNGFTLLEVMISLAILAIAMTTLFGSQSQSVSLAAEAKFNTTAALLARMKIAGLSAGSAEVISESGDFGEDFPGFTWQVEAEQPSFSSPEILTGLEEQLQQVDLTITWVEEFYTYKIRTYLFIGTEER